MIISLKFLSETNPVCYVSYVLSAYAFTALCANFPRAKKRCRELIHGDEVKIIVRFRRFMNSYKYTSMYLNNREFRARFSLYSGLAVNMFYAVFKCATGAVFRSAWLWAIGIYYVMLSLIRFTLLRNVRITDKKEHNIERKIHEYKSSRMCGIMMFALNIAMTGMTVQMIWRNRGYEYKGYIIYISAMYAFYCLINAIVNVVKFSKINNPILSSAKIISLAGALMSMFALQTAMFSAFGGGEVYQRLMNTITGGVVCTAVLGMAVFTIVWSNRNLKSLERSN
ncbi:MAG: hypothetical protein Q4E74_05115 [Ruminococcus sp.]|nr:hypothetical protein [Ruminococcus sp.]